ncbi:MAG: hypothetical protein Q8P72_02585 [Candidatus Roizmanbacteria bacterium]|nr:hypothetical protein [Candidatus Roizmanbacteria bacterium]
MSKKLLFVILFVFAAALAGCQVDIPEGVTIAGTPVPAGQYWVDVEQISPQPTPAAAAPAPEAPTPAAEGTTLCGSKDFSKWISDPYTLISLLDAQPNKVPQNSTSFLLSTDVPTIYWTGRYPGGASESFKRLSIDGQTGAFCLDANTEVSVNFVGAFMPADMFTEVVSVTTEDDMADSCVPSQIVVDLLNAFAQMDGERLFRELDALVNVEGAPYLSARFRPEPLAGKTYEDLTPATAVMWTQTGRIGDANVELAQSQGKSAYLNTEPELLMSYAHTGLLLCDPMDPANQLTYWGN